MCAEYYRGRRVSTNKPNLTARLAPHSIRGISPGFLMSVSVQTSGFRIDASECGSECFPDGCGPARDQVLISKGVPHVSRNSESWSVVYRGPVPALQKAHTVVSRSHARCIQFSWQLSNDLSRV